jgi:RNA polymerase sigma factor (TIGR02999 family)
MDDRVSDVTRLLDAIQHGDPTAADELLPLVYQELRKLAASKMAREQPGHTLQPTALVHEAWLRVAGNDGQAQFASRAQFFASAAEAMRRILVENARRKAAAKRGGPGRERVDLNDVDIAAPDADDRVLAVHEALDKFAAVDPQKAELVKLRYFAGLTNEQAAPLLDISEPTAKRWWAYARAWLQVEISSPPR